MASLVKQLEPRWPASIALLSVGGLRLILPRVFSFGPNWVLLVVVGLLVVPIIWAHYGGFDVLNRILGHLVTSIVTADMIWSLSLLITTIPDRKIAPQRDASFCCCSLGSQYSCLRVLVLEPRRWWPSRTRDAWCSHRWGFPVSANDAR